MHGPSKTLVCADFLFNVFHEDSALSKVLYRALGIWQCVGQNRLWKWRTKDKAAARIVAERLREFGPRRIVMAHGDVLDDGATQLLHYATEWLF